MSNADNVKAVAEYVSRNRGCDRADLIRADIVSVHQPRWLTMIINEAISQGLVEEYQDKEKAIRYRRPALKEPT
jgi:hypothetical protein